MLFVTGTELSPSWAHFNACPLDEGKTIDIDPGQAREMGADVVEVNHPYSGHGYFASLVVTYQALMELETQKNAD